MGINVGNRGERVDDEEERWPKAQSSRNRHSHEADERGFRSQREPTNRDTLG